MLTHHTLAAVVLLHNSCVRCLLMVLPLLLLEPPAGSAVKRSSMNSSRVIEVL